MFTKVFTVTDYRGVERQVECNFQLLESELVELQYSKRGGYEATAQRMLDEKDEPEIMNTYREIILKSYGEISEDGLHFNKSEEISNKFACTPMYDQLFMEILTGKDAFRNFIQNVLPESAKSVNFDKVFSELEDKYNITTEAETPAEGEQ